MAQPHARPLRVRTDAGGRGHHGAAGPGCRKRRRDGPRGSAPRRHLQSPRAPDRRSLHLLRGLGRRPDGRGVPRGMLACRSLEARASDRDLRRQPHHHRWGDQPHLERRHGSALRGLRLARPARCGRQRRRRPRCRPLSGPAGRRSAVARHRADAHRVRQPAQAGHPRGARLASRRGRSEADEAAPGLAEPRAIPCPRGVAGLLAQGARARRPARGRVAREVRGLPSGPPRARRRARATPQRPAPRRLGRRPARVHGEGRAGDACRFGQGPQRHRGEAARGDRRLGGPRRLDPGRLQGRRRRRGWELACQEHPFRRPRARHGRDSQRARPARRGAAGRLDLPDLLRVHAALDPARGAERAPRDLRLQPRLDRARRGRADPPTG